MHNHQQFCTFYINEHFFGIEVDKIQEVIRYQGMTPIPLSNQTINGLINLRGQIVTAINMHNRLNFMTDKNIEELSNIVIRTDEGAVSLLVDEIGDVIEVPDQQFESTPDNLDGEMKSLLKKVCRLDKELLLVLDIEEILNPVSQH